MHHAKLSADRMLTDLVLSQSRAPRIGAECGSSRRARSAIAVASTWGCNGLPYTTLLPALLEALGRNVSRGLVDAALFALAQVVQPTEETRGVELIPVHRRPTETEIAMLDASLPRQPQHVAAVLTGLREPRGPWGPGRRVEAADAFEAVRIIARASEIDVTLRAAQ